MTPTAAAVDLAGEVTAELDGLADVLEPLPAQRWDAASLCAGWRVREVVAHVALAAFRSGPAVVLQLARARFRWDVAADRMAKSEGTRAPADLVAALRSSRLREWRPPGGGAEGALTHAVVHGLDVTVPLGIARPLPPARAQVVLDQLVTPRSLGHFGIDLTGTQLHADDLDWTHGTGAPVGADAATLILALTGRRPLPDRT